MTASIPFIFMNDKSFYVIAIYVKFILQFLFHFFIFTQHYIFCIKFLYIKKFSLEIICSCKTYRRSWCHSTFWIVYLLNVINISRDTCMIFFVKCFIHFYSQINVLRYVDPLLRQATCKSKPPIPQLYFFFKFPNSSPFTWNRQILMYPPNLEILLLMYYCIADKNRGRKRSRFVFSFI